MNRVSLAKWYEMPHPCLTPGPDSGSEGMRKRYKHRKALRSWMEKPQHPGSWALLQTAGQGGGILTDKQEGSVDGIQLD